MAYSPRPLHPPTSRVYSNTTACNSIALGNILFNCSDGGCTWYAGQVALCPVASLKKALVPIPGHVHWGTHEGVTRAVSKIPNGFSTGYLY